MLAGQISKSIAGIVEQSTLIANGLADLLRSSAKALRTTLFSHHLAPEWNQGWGHLQRLTTSAFIHVLCGDEGLIILNFTQSVPHVYRQLGGGCVLTPFGFHILFVSF
jgi:hypothetical protein